MQPGDQVLFAGIDGALRPYELGRGVWFRDGVTGGDKDGTADSLLNQLFGCIDLTGKNHKFGVQRKQGGSGAFFLGV